MNTLLNNWLDQNGYGAATRLSKASGLSRSYISELASGKCGARLTADTAQKLAKGTGIKATVWLGLEEPSQPCKSANSPAGLRAGGASLEGV